CKSFILPENVHGTISIKTPESESVSADALYSAALAALEANGLTVSQDGPAMRIGVQARLVPALKNGVYQGMKIFLVLPSSLYAKIGIQNGDVIRRINGAAPEPNKAFEVYGMLKGATPVDVELERRGSILHVKYRG